MTTRSVTRTSSRTAPTSWPSPGAPDPHRMPTQRPTRAVVEPVRPIVDSGAFPAKAAINRPMTVLADVFADGHDIVSAALLTRPLDAPWTETPMRLLGNDRFTAAVVPDRLGRWEYDVVGWVSHFLTWRRGALAKIDADQDVDLDLRTGHLLVKRMAERPHERATDEDRRDLHRFAQQLLAGDGSAIAHDRWLEVAARAERREPTARFEHVLRVDVDPVLATTGSWYSFFPRSVVADDTARPDAGTLRGAIARLDYIADMGFDVAYIPPVHPIGATKRKGRNNATLAEAQDVGSPYAIGSADGGHRSVDPALGTVQDVADLASACRDRGMQLAIDIAFNCSPDHPWVREHPEWFTRRPDGSIQYAQNPPKKYEDIYPLDFESDDWQALWNELVDVFRFWIDQGVTVFRVDNPHTKPFAFWEWALATLRSERPDVIFLSEAFTRPRVMQRLAKIGFNQSYTYFAWRYTARELREYFTELSTETLDYLRPNAWPNTHDILTTQLQTGGRSAFVMRAVLAATLSPSWGVYGPVYELLENQPREGVEDYIDSEKYQVREWNLDRDDSLAPLLQRLNEIRREQPSLTSLETIRFHNTDNDALLCFTKTDPSGGGDPVLVVVNVDAHQEQSGFVDVDLHAIGLEYGAEYDVVDRLGGVTYRWVGNHNFVSLAPWGAMAHVFTVHRPGRGVTGGDPS